jgi:hypothetical protein
LPRSSRTRHSAQPIVRASSASTRAALSSPEPPTDAPGVNLREEVATGYAVADGGHCAAWTPTPPWRLIDAILAGVASLPLASYVDTSSTIALSAANWGNQDPDCRIIAGQDHYYSRSPVVGSDPPPGRIGPSLSS